MLIVVTQLNLILVEIMFFEISQTQSLQLDYSYLYLVYTCMHSLWIS